MGAQPTRQTRDRLQELRELLALAEAECTRHMIDADRLTPDDGGIAMDLIKYDDTIMEARKHARIAAQLKRQIVTLGAEVKL